MIKENNIIKECPDKETIGLFYDNELSYNESIFSHIQNCYKCQNILKQYNEISKSIKKEFEISGKNKLVGRIQYNVRKEINTIYKYRKFYMYLKIASLIIILATITTMLQFNKNSIIKQDAVFTSKINQNAKKLKGNIKSKEIEFITPNLQNLSKVNYGDSTQNDIQPSTNTPKTPKFIKDIVKHTWLTENTQGLKILIMKKYKPVYATNNNKTKIILNITKNNLVKLVKQYHKNGEKLLSSQYPQPENRKFYGSPNESVQYELTIIESD